MIMSRINVAISALCFDSLGNNLLSSQLFLALSCCTARGCMCPSSIRFEGSRVPSKAELLFHLHASASYNLVSSGFEATP